MADYAYTIAQFASLLEAYAVPSLDRLTNEAEEQIIAPVLTEVNLNEEADPDQVIFSFDGVLSDPIQIDLLDSVVGAHDGSPLAAPDPGEMFDEYYQEASEGNSSTTSADWQDKLVLTRTLAGGTYEIEWYAETWANVSNREYGFRVVLDGVDVLGWSDTEHVGSTVEMNKSGFAVRDLDNSPHSIVLQYCRVDVNTTAYIRRARLRIRRVA